MDFNMYLAQQIKKDEEEMNKTFKDLERAKEGFMKSRNELEKMINDLGYNKGL